MKTGRTEKILGYACEEYLSKHKKGETEVWVTAALGKLSGFYWGEKDAEKSVWQKHLASKGFFPLRIVDRKSAGNEAMRMEAASVTPKSLPDSLFEIPKDYRNIELPKFLNMKEVMKGVVGAVSKE